MKTGKLICALVLGATTVAALFGCASGGSEGGKTVEGEKPKAAQTELNFALVPSEDAEAMAEGFEPIRAQMEKDLGMKVNLLRLTDYTSAIESMRAGKVDVAWYGPLSMVLAKQQAEASAFAIPVVKGKGESYKSLIVVKAGSNITSVDSLEGKKLALVDPGSTSGNLLPRFAILKATKRKAEEVVGEVTYAGSHDAALLALQGGSVDACGIQDITYDAFIKKGQLKESDVNIIWTSDPIPASPFGMRKGLDPDLAKKITNSLLGMHEKGVMMNVPGQGEIVKFVAVTQSAYDPIEQLASTLGLSAKDMAK